MLDIPVPRWYNLGGVIKLDEELRSAIREELNPIKQDMTRMDQDIKRIGLDISRIDQNMTHMEQEITRIKIVMENDVQRQLNLLAKGQRLILERLTKPAVIEDLTNRIDTLETVVTHHSADIAELKKAL